MIIVCGGDGTINDVVCALAHSRIPLAILPGGTANMLARELGLPLDLVAAARKIPASRPRRVALGLAGDRYFISVAGAGFDARVVHGLNWRWKALFSMGSYVLEAIRQMLFAPPGSSFVVSNGVQRHDARFACVARVKHYGPVRAIKEADLFSDEFYVYCFNARSRFRYLLYPWVILLSRPSRLPEFSAFSAQRVCCEATSPGEESVFLQVDGELLGTLPCTVQIVPDALTLLVPSWP